MARASAVDPCLICGGLPCVCNAKKKAAPRKAQPRKAKPEPKPLPEPAVTPEPEPAPRRQSMVERMRARAAAAPAVLAAPAPAQRRARPTAKSAELPQLSADELAELQAIRLLNDAFGIREEDLVRWKPYLDRPASTQERAASWKARRNVATEGNT